MIARTIIKNALKRLVIVSADQEPSTSQYAEGLEILNDIVGQWSGNTSMIYEEEREHIVVPADTLTFTVGPTGNVVTARPLRIVYHTIREGGVVVSPTGGWTGGSFCEGEFPTIEATPEGTTREYPLEKSDVVVHGQFYNKATTQRPTHLYYQNTFPDGTFHFNCTTDQVYTIILNSYKELSQFPDLDTVVNLPKYYESALKKNLTVELAPQMCSASRITPLMVKQAEDAIDTIIGRAIKVNTSITELSRRYAHGVADSNSGY